jgi:hypothetical protein
VKRRTTNIPEDRRREIFYQLVVLREAGLADRSSREWIARQHAVGVEVVEAVEREGQEKQWPPLGGQ